VTHSPGYCLSLDLLDDPAQLASLVISSLPYPGQERVVVCGRAPPQDELRLVGRLIVLGFHTRQRVADDDVATDHFYGQIRPSQHNS